MRYHSARWWLAAIYAQIRHIIRNVLMRGLLNVHFGLTVPDRLTLYIQDNAEALYQKLVQLYPEFQNLHKYVKFRVSFTCMEITAVAIAFINRGAPVIWSYDSTVEDIIFFLSRGCPCNVQVRRQDGTPHSVAVVAYDNESDELIYNDPLGDPAFRHRLVFGFNVRCKSADFGKICIGDPVRMVVIPADNFATNVSDVTTRYAGRKLYSCFVRGGPENSGTT